MLTALLEYLVATHEITIIIIAYRIIGIIDIWKISVILINNCIQCSSCLFVVAKVVAKVPFSPGHEMVGEVSL